MISSSFPACWENNLGKKIGQAFRLSVLNTKNGIHLSRVLACQNELLSHGTEIAKTNQGKCASSQSYQSTRHLLSNNCFLDDKQLVGSPF